MKFSFILRQHPNYRIFVTTTGLVYKNGNRAKLSTRPDGYKVVSVGGRGAPVVRVHKLVLETFVGPPPSNKPIVRHLNGDRGDNELGNLKYGTLKENTQDAIRHGTFSPPPILSGRRNHFYRGVKDSDAMLNAINDYLSGELSSRQAEKKYGVSRSHMLRCAKKEAARREGGS